VIPGSSITSALLAWFLLLCAEDVLVTWAVASPWNGAVAFALAMLVSAIGRSGMSFSFDFFAISLASLLISYSLMDYNLLGESVAFDWMATPPINHNTTEV
jgi:hypothetical protein